MVKALIFSDIHNDGRALAKLMAIDADVYFAAGDLVSWARGLDKMGDLMKSRAERVYVLPPGSQLGPITPQQRQQLLQNSLVAGVYEKNVDRESAYEKLKERAEAAAPQPGTAGQAASGGILGGLNDILFGSTGPRGAKYDGLAQSMAKSAVRTMGSAVGREIIRGVLGSLLGSKKR